MICLAGLPNTRTNYRKYPATKSGTNVWVGGPLEPTRHLSRVESTRCEMSHVARSPKRLTPVDLEKKRGNRARSKIVDVLKVDVANSWGGIGTTGAITENVQVRARIDATILRTDDHFPALQVCRF